MSPAIDQLDDLIAFNDQLLALDEAGVPIGFSSSKDLAAELEKINSSLARHVSRGKPVREALETEADVPDWYRTLALSAFNCQEVDTALDDFSRIGKSADSLRYVKQSALFYPLIVASFAYFGIIGFCLFFVPSLQSAYAGFRIPAGSGLKVLGLLRETLPFWVAVPPIVMIWLLVRQVRQRRTVRAETGRYPGVVARLSGAARAIEYERSAYLAESIACFDETGVPLDEAVALASGDPRPAAVAQAGAAPPAKERPLTSAAKQPEEPKRLPPFLRWALFNSEPSVARHVALGMAAAIYRQASHHAMERARIITPIILLVTIGGTVTLLYGLALFVPVVQMLKAVALTPLKGH